MSHIFHSIVQAYGSAWKKLSRVGLNAFMSFQPAEKRIAAERRFRGREQTRKLGLANIVFVSFGKSGRTWLRVMLSRLFQVKYGISQRTMIGFDNFHSMNRKIPKMFFTHDNYIGDYTGHVDSKVDFYGKKVVLMARDPRDVAVSQFFQWKHRMNANKIFINHFPPQETDLSTYQFVMETKVGLTKVVDFMNLWANEADKLGDFFLLRYEDLKSNPEETLEKLLKFMGTPGTDEEIKEAVRFSSVDNMRKMEQKNNFWLSGGRMAPRDRSNPNSYKVRRAKVGGYRDYFSDEEVAEIDAALEKTLSPVFGYTLSTDLA